MLKLGKPVCIRIDWIIELDRLVYRLKIDDIYNCELSDDMKSSSRCEMIGVDGL